jgi:precorrin-2 C20-methyltransferase/precorrin-3B C17-methyltransferase
VAGRAIYVERASAPEERVAPLPEVGGKVPYMSLVLVPTAARTRATSGDRGQLTVVGLGPAGPQWLTPEAQGELAAADHLVGYATYLDRVPARPGQHRHASDNRVEAERAHQALALAAAGARVAVVSSGDPGIYAMAAAVLEAAEEGNGQYADVDVRVIPGLSAMQAAAARVGAPLGHDFCVVSLSDILKPWEIVERRLRAAGAADLVVALYNPASRTRRDQLARAIEVLLEHRAPPTPVVVARAVGSDAESVTVTTLSQLDLEVVDMRTLLIVGSSTTRVVQSGNGTVPQVYTPRRYPA